VSRHATPATAGTADIYEKFVPPPTTMQQHLPQQEIQRTGLSVQAPSSTNNDTLKAAIIVRRIITELTISEAVSEKDKIMVITKMVPNLTMQNGF
jgi:hypothetical protein